MHTLKECLFSDGEGAPLLLAGSRLLQGEQPLRGVGAFQALEVKGHARRWKGEKWKALHLGNRGG